MAEMRIYFERAVKDTPVLEKNTPLGVMEINSAFSHYMDADTDTLWIGFALGMRCHQRTTAVTIRELQKTIAAYEEQWVDENV